MPGLALNFRLTVYPGIIDSEFRGAACVAAFNDSGNDCKILSNARIAQLLIKPHKKVKFIKLSELTSTERNLSGIGLTGKF